MHRHNVQTLLQVTLIGINTSKLRVNGTGGQMWGNMNRSNSTKVTCLFRSGNTNLSCLQRETYQIIKSQSQLSNLNQISAHHQDGARCVSIGERRNVYSLQILVSRLKSNCPFLGLDSDQTALPPEKTNLSNALPLDPLPGLYIDRCIIGIHEQDASLA